MAYNRYVGGRAYRVEEPPPPPVRISPLPPEENVPVNEPPDTTKKPSGALRSLRSGLDGILSHLDPGHLDTEDLLVLAILWLLYRDSGQREMLIAMGAYLFL